MTKTERLISYLNSGRRITAADARRIFGMNNLSARINELRTAGFCVYTNRPANGTTNYRIGQPTKAIVSAAYRTRGSKLFNS
jgi:Helix-turn-helix domain